MTIKKGLVFLIAAMLIVFTGCDNNSSTSTGAGKAFIGGTQGLVLGFIDGAPPREVFDTSSDFSVSIRMENVGEFAVDSNSVQNMPVLKITGVDPADFGHSGELRTIITEELMGTSMDAQGNIIQGTMYTVDFPETGGLQYGKEVSGSVTFNLRANLCYEYGTKAQAKLCVREDLLGTKGKAAACNVNEEKRVENSGAPIQITSLKESVMGKNKISFMFKISHVGSGRVYQQGLSPACDASSYANKDKVWVEVTSPDLGQMTCSGLKDGASTASGDGKVTGYTTLYNGERSIMCNIEIPDSLSLIHISEPTRPY